MSVDTEELLPLLKQLAEGVLKIRIEVESLRGRVGRLEHMLTVNKPHATEVAQAAKDPIYSQRDIIGVDNADCR